MQRPDTVSLVSFPGFVRLLFSTVLSCLNHGKCYTDDKTLEKNQKEYFTSGGREENPPVQNKNIREICLMVAEKIAKFVDLLQKKLRSSPTGHWICSMTFDRWFLT